MTPLTQQVNSQPQASSWATGSGHEHFMCCHTPITNTEPGNECVKERIVIWMHWKRESRLIWHQGVLLPLFCDLDQITSPVPAFPSLCTILHCLSAVFCSCPSQPPGLAHSASVLAWFPHVSSHK